MTSSHEQRVANVLRAFEREFGRRPEGVADAPGRANLIGEHVDYNEGLVLPFAIERSVLVAWARRDADTVRARSLDDDETVEFHARDVGRARHGSWSNYLRGVVDVLRRAGHDIGGIDLAVTGDVPVGAGLSSSAAIEVAVSGALRDAFGLRIDDVTLALLCQRAENEFVGVQSGIMDQFASTLARAGHALLLDCRSLAHRHVPLALERAGLAVVLADSGVQRSLVASAYNERRRECEAAVAALRAALGRPDITLRDASEADIARARLGGAIARRARHVVREIARVREAVTALERDDFAAVGRLMAASHASLRDDYEVSSAELDLLVELATRHDYVLGARLTGAGFGGCTINLVRADALAAFERDVIGPYRERTRLPASMYVTQACDSLRTWRL